MRCLIILVTICLSFPAIGQTLNQKDLIAIVKLAFEQDKLPSDIVPKLDTLHLKSLPERFMIIESNEKLGINRRYEDKVDNVMIWSGEEIFLYDVSYWMKLLEITRKGDKAIVQFETMTGVSRPKIPARCFRGEIKGKFDGAKWILVKSKSTQIDCKFGIWSEEK